MKVCTSGAEKLPERPIPGRLYEYDGDVYLAGQLKGNSQILIDVKDGKRKSFDEDGWGLGKTRFRDVTDEYCLVKGDER